MGNGGERPQSGARLGILGGGQLARMLSEAAMRQGLRVTVLAQSHAASAAIEGVDLVIGELDDETALAEMVERCDFITTENEFIDLDRVEAALERRPNVRFRPRLSGIGVAQDKLEQKRVLGKLGIATAAFETVRAAALDEDLKRLQKRFPGGFVMKWSRFGYDGRGNLMVSSPEDYQRDEIRQFCEASEAAGGQVYAEERIDFTCELAMVSTRADDGAQEFFPLVVSRQERGICREVFGPAVCFDVESRVEEQAIGILKTIGAELEMCGTFAIEFFLCRDGRLLVNEMAPRVHNTGHYTLFDEEPSQFDLHVQAVLGRPISRPAPRGLAMMRNILGPPWIDRDLRCPVPVEEPPAGTLLYWYDKSTVSPGRKMGHLTGRGKSIEEVFKLLEEMKAYEDRFWSGIAREKGTD